MIDINEIRRVTIRTGHMTDCAVLNKTGTGTCTCRYDTILALCQEAEQLRDNEHTVVVKTSENRIVSVPETFW